MNRSLNVTWSLIGTGFAVFLFAWGWLAPPTQAAKYDIVLPSTPGSYTQPEFHDFSEQVGLAISYVPLAPAEPLGMFGFDVGVEVTAVNIDDEKSFWTAVIPNGSPPNYLSIPKLHAQVGLPFGIDLGAVYGKAISSNLEMVGGEVKWAFVKGTLATPAIALRGSYTALFGVDHLDVTTYGVDISISKGVSFLTPYGGIGETWITGSSDAPGLGLQHESIAATKGFVGLKFGFPLLSFAAEADFSKVPAYSLRASLGF